MKGQKMAKNNRKQVSPHQEWLEMWGEFDREFVKLPLWAQKILLRDMNTAFKNRVLVIQKVQSLPSYRGSEFIIKSLNGDRKATAISEVILKCNP